MPLAQGAYSTVLVQPCISRRFWFLQALPQSLIRISKRWQIPKSSMAVRLLYDVPLEHIDHFWEPPARLLLRSVPYVRTPHPPPPPPPRPSPRPERYMMCRLLCFMRHSSGQHVHPNPPQMQQTSGDETRKTWSRSGPCSKKLVVHESH